MNVLGVQRFCKQTDKVHSWILHLRCFDMSVA